MKTLMLATALTLAPLATVQAAAAGLLTLKNSFVVCKTKTIFEAVVKNRALESEIQRGNCRRYKAGDRVYVSSPSEHGAPFHYMRIWAPSENQRWVVPYPDIRTEVMNPN